MTSGPSPNIKILSSPQHENKAGPTHTESSVTKPCEKDLKVTQSKRNVLFLSTYFES